MLKNKKTDKSGYNEFYKEKVSDLFKCTTADEYISLFEKTGLSPYYKGGGTKGYVRGLAVNELFEATKNNEASDKVTILDAGCGLGELSVYLASKGFNVIGVDISKEACNGAMKLAEQVGVIDRCNFLANSLEQIDVDDLSIDFIIGHASLHHFIKYEKIPKEFNRVMKLGSKGFFADSFGENKLYHIFHNKEEMERLGDVILTKKLVMNYFRIFKTEITPADWFVMLDKLYLRVFPKKLYAVVKKISKFHFWLDRKLPTKSRVSLYLSGAIMTKIEKT